MSVQLQTLLEKYEQIITDIENEIGQATPAQQKAFNRVLAMAIAGIAKTGDRFIISQLRKVFPSTTYDDGLDEWITLSNTVVLGPIPALLTIDIVGGTPSATVSGGQSGPVWVGPNGKTYFAQDATFNLDGNGDATINIEAFEGGEATNIDAGTTINLTAPNADLPQRAIVTAIASSGNDGETDDEIRADVVTAVSRPPMGGAVADYDKWARERPNIEKGYTYSGSVPGRVELYITASDQPDKIPTQAQLDDVYDYIQGDIDGEQRIPIWALDQLPDGTDRFEVLASTPTSFITTITGLVPDTSENRASIETALDSYYGTIEPFIKGLSLTNNGTITQNALISVIQQVVETQGLDGFTSVSFATAAAPGTPLTEYPVGKGERAKSTYSWS